MTYELDRSGHRPKTGAVRPEFEHQKSPQDRRGRLVRVILVGLLSLALIGAPSVGFAGEKAAQTGREGGLGAAAAVSSLIYGPVKLLYATGGLVVGAFAWAFTAGDTQVAERVFTRSLRGTYVITPDILTGDKELVFIGRDVQPGEATGTRAFASAADAQPAAEASEPAPLDDETGYDEMGW